MIKDESFLAQIGTEYIACVRTPDNEVAIRTSNPDFKTALEDALNHTYATPLLHAVPNKIYHTGKTSALAVAAALMTISSETQIIEAPDEVLNELQKIAGNTPAPVYTFNTPK